MKRIARGSRDRVVPDLLLLSTIAEIAGYLIARFRWGVKVRIKKTPAEREIDGIPLKGMLPGAVRDVSAVLGSWLIMEGYADTEMRQRPSTNDFDASFSFEHHPSMPRERRSRKR